MSIYMCVYLSFFSLSLSIYIYIMSQVWTMKLTESTNICYVSDMVTCTIKMNVKQTFMGNDSFLKCICGEWTAVGE